MQHQNLAQVFLQARAVVHLVVRVVAIQVNQVAVVLNLTQEFFLLNRAPREAQVVRVAQRTILQAAQAVAKLIQEASLQIQVAQVVVMIAVVVQALVQVHQEVDHQVGVEDLYLGVGDIMEDTQIHLIECSMDLELVLG